MKKEKKRKNGYKTLEKLIPLSNGKCPLCFRSIDLEGIKAYVSYMKNESRVRVRRKNIDVNIDHIIPIEKGGTNDIGNMQLVHPYCNALKSDRLGIVRNESMPLIRPLS